MSLAIITIRIDPELHLGPLTVAWHGLTIAIGILIGALVAARWAREHKLDTEPLVTLTALLAIGGILGGRLFYLLEHDPAALVHPGELLSTTGFTFDGGMILATVALGVYLWRAQLSARYLDAIAVGLPLGVAIGRIGDVINGEHYGARSDFFLAVRNAHPDALTPNPAFAYHNGGLYEVLLATMIFAIVWPLRHRLRRPTMLAWLVLALFAIGRFFEFFLRADSPDLALGLNNAQWTSLALLAAAAAGAAYASRLRRAAPARAAARRTRR
jgi:phosphatidylglycerol---prolipoprotein diacylglyceryl transferase